MTLTIILDIVFVLVGFYLLLKGGDFLVEGAVSIARIARLSPMVIGISVVGFGTSSPELLVSIEAAWQGSSGIAIGNVVGSNIANIGMILGVVALICRIPVKRESMRIDLPFMMLAVALLALAGSFGNIYRWQGLLGVLLLILYVVWKIRDSRHNPDPNAEASLAAFRQYRTFGAILVIIASCAALWFGAYLLIDGAKGIAMILGTHMGASPTEMERIIGLTIVAVGTSLPEFFASVIAARRGQTDMALGNIIGSVTFNILSVIGVASAICPIHNTNVGFIVDYIVMVLISMVLYLFSHLHHALVRWEGAVLLLIYVGYIVYTFYI